MESPIQHTAFLMLADADLGGMLQTIWSFAQIFIGFSLIILVHELGHFAVAKWAGVRVEQFAVGFFREIVGFTRGETRYSFNLLPLGGYVKMLGQEDFEIDKSGEVKVKDDPRSFGNKSVGARMAIVSAGVIMNVLFAALLFMIVYLVGREAEVPRIGGVLPEGPAAMAGIQPGDVVKTVNGSEVNDFNELSMAIMLSEPNTPLKMDIERDGQIKTLSMTPERDPQMGRLLLGINPAKSAEIIAIGPDYSMDNPRHPRPGDKVVEIDGQPVDDSNAWSMMDRLFTNPLAVKDVVVERPTSISSEDSPTERVKLDLVSRLALKPADLSGNRPHLLGLAPLVRVSGIEEDSRAHLAGLEVGDVILKWGDVEYPSDVQIDRHIVTSAKKDQDKPEQDIPVVVYRAKAGRKENLVIRPHVKIMPLTGSRSRPTVGATFRMLADGYLLVAEVVPTVDERQTPAALSGIPAGAVITKVGDKPVSRWIELAEYFRGHADQDVTLTYDMGTLKDRTCSLHVPPSVRTILNVGPESVIASIDGDEFVQVSVKDLPVADDAEKGGLQRPRMMTLLDGESSDGKSGVRVSVGHPAVMRAVLNERIGQTVQVTYRASQFAEAVTVDLPVTEEMVDPWVGLMEYTMDLGVGSETRLVRKTNPIAAIGLGVKKTYYFILNVYQTFRRMIVSRSLGIENIQGPVGILKLGGQMAESGPVDLIFFLAILSANLAVLNFLPLPIVDGGLMVFLIIEKIKGSAVSIKVQMATQIIGLVLIASFFLYVTVQDIMMR